MGILCGLLTTKLLHVPSSSLPSGVAHLPPEDFATIRSRAEEHRGLPHIVKFSGGRSSAALAFLLAEQGLLEADRGDVILFANTSAEHPGTYMFARECKRRLENDFGLPVFWFEFCTVEDASGGYYVRRPSYRLVRAEPFEEDPLGYRSHGEVFEEMLSFQGMLPNPHTRSCTAKLKLQPSHQLLAEWLGCTQGPAHAGHYANRSYVTPRRALAKYRRAGGKAESEAFLRRVAYMIQQPSARPAQRWCDYTDAPLNVSPSGCGPVSMWGPDAKLHITILGLRADEANRINRVMQRSMFAEGASGWACAVRNQPPGERPCFPLADWGYDANAVRRFWQSRPFDLKIPEHAGNCVFCFMKGTKALGYAANQPDRLRVSGAPSDVGWWVNMERRYRRDVPARNGGGTTRFGFFGIRGPAFSEISAGGNDASARRYACGTPACDCTD